MWTSLPIIGFDTETTGVRPLEDRLVTCSIIRATEDGIERRYWLADPGVEIPAQAASVHGISTEKAHEEGRPVVEVLEEIASVLAEHMGRGNPVVAFNASYDLTLLESELARHSLPTLENRLGGRLAPVVDPYLLDKSVDRYRKGKRRLEDLCRHYGVSDEDNFHNAEADVIATLRLLGALVRKYPELAGKSLEEIQAMEAASHADFISYLNRRAAEDGRRPAGDPNAWPLASRNG
ncbi:exonuclease domain-containing protein [Actinomycetaceae bacterium L2_0104]